MNKAKGHGHQGSLGIDDNKLAILLSNLPGMAYRCKNDHDWTMEFISEGCFGLTGYQPEDLIGNHLLTYNQIILPQDQTYVWDTIQECVSRGEKYTLTYRILTADQQEKTVWEQGQAILDEAGQIVGLEGFITDISGRQKAEEELRENRARYESLFENSPISLWEEDFSDVKIYIDELRRSGVTDLRAYFEQYPEAVIECVKLVKVLAVNNTTLTLLGATSKSELLDALSKTLASEAYETFKEELITLGEGNLHFEADEIIYRLNGEMRHVHLTLSVDPGFAETLSRVLVSIVDITERRLAEQALHESEERYRTAFDYAPVGIGQTDLTGKYFNVNRKLCEITGYTAEEMLKLTFQEITHPDDQAVNLEKTSRQLDGQFQMFKIEKRYIRKDGSSVWVEVTSNLIRDWDGTPLYQIGIIEDISQRKLAEEKIQHQINELQALYEVGVALSSTLDPQKIAQKLIDVLTEKLHWHHISIRLRKEGEHSDQIELLAFSTINKKESWEEADRSRRLISRVGQGLIGWVIAHGEIVRLSPVANDPRYIETIAGIESGLYVPMKLGENVIGAIAVESEKKNAFTREDERLLTTLLAQAAVALENARLYQNTTRTIHRREVLYRASHRVTQAAQDLEDVYAALHAAAVELMPADVFVISLLDESHQVIRGVYLIEDGRRTPELQIPYGKGLSGYVIKTGQTYRTGNSLQNPHIQVVRFGSNDNEGARSILAVPIRIGTMVIGMISVQTYLENIYDEDDQEILEMLTSFASVTIRNAQLFQQTRMRMEELATISKVSGVVRAAETRPEIMAVILKQISNLLQVEHACLAALDENSGESIIEHGVGDWKAAIGTRIPAGEGPIGLVAANQQTYVSTNILRETQPKLQDLYQNVRAVIGLPLLVQNKCIGSLWVGRTTHNGESFASMEVSLLTSIANITASALNRVFLRDQAVLHAVQMEVVSELGRTLAGTNQLEEMYRTLAVAIYDLLPSIDGILISEFDEKHRLIKCVCGHTDGDFIDPSNLPLLAYAPEKGGNQSTVIKTGKPILIDDLRKYFTSQRPHTKIGNKKKPVPLSALYVPMLSQGVVIGVVQAQSYSPKRFTQEDAKLLTLAANTAGVEIQNASLLVEAQRRAEQLIRINELGRTLAETTQLNDIYPKLAQIALDLVPGSITISIALYDEKEKQIRTVFSIHDHNVVDVSQLLPMDLLPPGQGIQSDCILNGKTLIFSEQDLPPGPSTKKAKRSKQKGASIQSSVCVPMIAHGQTIGVMQLQSYEKDYYVPNDAELLSLVANTAAVSIENARLFSQIQRQLEQLSSLRTIDVAISSNTNLSTTLSIILDHVRMQLGVDAADVLMLNSSMVFSYAGGKGFHSKEIQNTSAYFGNGHVVQAVLDGRTIFIGELQNDPSFVRKTLMQSEQFISHCVTPLLSKGKIIGVLEVWNRSLLRPDREWLAFLEMLANEAAIAIDNIRMFQELQQSNVELMMAYDATIEGWAQALDLRDSETEGHSRRVVELAMQLARVLGIQGEQLIHIRRGAILHDIGKMGIPDAILSKPGPLSEDEWQIMRQHPVLAYSMLARVPYLKEALDIPYCHHEKWDGSGYPRKLKGEDIPLAARIFAVADVYDALTNDRPYRKALSKAEALEMIKEQTGKHFDPKMVEVFLRIIPN